MDSSPLLYPLLPPSPQFCFVEIYVGGFNSMLSYDSAAPAVLRLVLRLHSTVELCLSPPIGNSPLPFLSFFLFLI